MLQVIRQSEFIEGRWRNGMGTSWEIAALRAEGAADFSWRLAKARIDADVPFSLYPGMDRVFMQLQGQGLDLEFEGGRIIHVHESLVPHRFSCDIPLNCRLLNGPCMDLNLFTARRDLRSDVSVIELAGEQSVSPLGKTTVFFALSGSCRLSAGSADISLGEGDAAVAHDERQVDVGGNGAKLFIGRLIGV